MTYKSGQMANATTATPLKMCLHQEFLEIKLCHFYLISWLLIYHKDREKTNRLHEAWKFNLTPSLLWSDHGSGNAKQPLTAVNLYWFLPLILETKQVSPSFKLSLKTLPFFSNLAFVLFHWVSVAYFCTHQDKVQVTHCFRYFTLFLQVGQRWRHLLCDFAFSAD